MVRGCDVWLNLPRPPLEASGTSGMKSAVNGGLQLSVLDGWWAEGYDGENGWALPGEEDPDHGAQDHRDATELHRLLERGGRARVLRPRRRAASRARGSRASGARSRRTARRSRRRGWCATTWSGSTARSEGPEVAGRPSGPPGTRWLPRLVLERPAAERADSPVSRRGRRTRVAGSAGIGSATCGPPFSGARRMRWRGDPVLRALDSLVGRLDGFLKRRRASRASGWARTNSASVCGGVPGEPLDGVGDARELAGRDRRVGADPGVDLPLRRAVGGARRARLRERLVLVRDRLARQPRPASRRSRRASAPRGP